MKRALFQDQVEQFVDFALGGQGACDLDQLAKLVAVAVQRLTATFAARFHGHQLEGLMQRDEQLFRGGGRRKQRTQPEVQCLAQVRIARAPEQDQARFDSRELIQVRAEQIAAVVPDGRWGDQNQEAAPAHREQERVRPSQCVVALTRVLREPFCQRSELIRAGSRARAERADLTHGLCRSSRACCSRSRSSRNFSSRCS